MSVRLKLLQQELSKLCQIYYCIFSCTHLLTVQPLSQTGCSTGWMSVVALEGISLVPALLKPSEVQEHSCMACTRASLGKDVLPAPPQHVAPGSTTVPLSGEASLIGIHFTSMHWNINWNLKHSRLWLKIHHFDQYDTEVVLGCLAPSVFHKIPIGAKSKSSLGSVMGGEKKTFYISAVL